MNRSRTNVLMVLVLVASLVLALSVTPGAAGDSARQFGGVVAQAAHQMHDGYMKLFH